MKAKFKTITNIATLAGLAFILSGCGCCAVNNCTPCEPIRCYKCKPKICPKLHNWTPDAFDPAYYAV